LVPRTDLLAALAEARAGRDAAAAHAADTSALEEQLARTQRQLRAAQADAAAQMQATLSDMVPRSELVAARARAEEAEEWLREHEERQREATEALKERLAALQRDNDQLTTKVQVRDVFCPPARVN
jgi:hypothetical protein